MRQHNVPGLYGIDVRALTLKIREKGTMKAKLVFETDDENTLDFVDINADNLVAAVSRKVIRINLIIRIFEFSLRLTSEPAT